MKSLCLMLGPDFITDILEVDFHDNWSFMQEAWSTMRDRSDDSLTHCTISGHSNSELHIAPFKKKKKIIGRDFILK